MGVRSAAAALAALVVAGVSSAAPVKGDGPISIAAGYGSVWVGTGNGTLVRIDARTGRVQARLLREPLIQYGFVRTLASGFGSVWAGDQWELVRVDPRTNGVRQVEGVAWFPSTVAVGRGAVWVADSGRNVLFRVDPRRMGVVARIRFEGRLWGLAAGPAGVWVVRVPTSGAVTGPEGPREILRIDPASNRPAGQALQVGCDVALAVGSSSAWAVDNCSGTLRRIDARTGAFAGPTVDVGGGAPVVGEGAVWLANGTSVVRVDAARQRVVATIAVEGSSLAVGAGAVWVLASDGRLGRVVRIDPRSNRIIGRPIRIDR